jgi:glutathionylspermidine synthase
LPAYFDDDPKAATLGASYVRKPLYSREGANIELIRNGRAMDKDDGPYGAEGSRATGDCRTAAVRRKLHGARFLVCRRRSLRVREDLSPITKNNSRFLPHAIVE